MSKSQSIDPAEDYWDHNTHAINAEKLGAGK